MRVTTGTVWSAIIFLKCFAISKLNFVFPDDVGVTEGCTIDLSIEGLDASTVTWTSIDLNGIEPDGTWDNLLDCTSGCQDITVTPIPGVSPSSVSYQMCGQLPGGCVNETICDTITVNIYPDLFADAGPDVAFCEGSFVPVTSTGTAIGGTPPFTYEWVGFSGPGAGFMFTTVDQATAADVVFNQPGQYELTITDANGCAIAVDTMEVYTFATAIQSVINTVPSSICFEPTPTITLEGYVTETFTGNWSSSAGGNFSSAGIDGTATAPANTPQFVDWTPIPGTTGIVTLTLTPTNVAGCPNTPASIDVDLTQFTSTLTILPSKSFSLSSE